MRRLILFLPLPLVFALPAMAADRPRREPSPAQAAQQEKMRRCNADAREQSLQREARRSFMKECLSGGKASQQ